MTKVEHIVMLTNRFDPQSFIEEINSLRPDGVRWLITDALEYQPRAFRSGSMTAPL
jgi:hypothetical protein